MEEKEQILGNSQGNIDAEFSGKSPAQNRIAELTTSLTNAKDAFKEAGKNINWQIGIWVVVCIGCIVVISCFFKALLKVHFEQQYWTWQYVYYTAIRLTAISGLYYISSFAFNMLKSVIHLYQDNKRKQAIIASMASFAESASDPSNRTAILNKLIEMVVDEKVLIGDKKDEAQLTVQNSLIDKLAEALKKK